MRTGRSPRGTYVRLEADLRCEPRERGEVVAAVARTLRQLAEARKINVDWGVEAFVRPEAGEGPREMRGADPAREEEP